MDVDVPSTPSPYSVYNALDRPSILDRILDISSPIAIYRLKMTCRAASRAVNGYVDRAFDINRHLEHFFKDPFSFRVLLARTNAIVSGSNALQFFDRTHYATSDLDLYVSGARSAFEICQWLDANGYKFDPSEHKRGPKGPITNMDDLLVYCKIGLVNGEINEKASDWDSMVPHNHSSDDNYRRTVLDFFQPRNNEGERLHVQIICETNSPVEAILSYHSSKSHLL